MPYLGNEVAPLVQALEGKELKLDSDGDSSITADTDDRVDVKVGGSDKLHVTSTGLGIGTTSPDGALHVKGISDHGRIVLESGGTTGANNNMFMQFHNNGGTEIAQIAIEEGATNEGQLIFKTGGTTTAMTIDKDGHITKPLQPACLVRAAANSNFAINTTHTVNYTTEVYDQNGDFSTSNNQFTAPVTGRYLIAQSLYYNNVVSNASYLSALIYTSNRSYVSIINPATFDQDSAYHTLNISVVADLDANDVVQSRYYQAGGSATTDLVAETFLSVCLLA